MSKLTVKLFKCMISLIGFMILRFFVLILETVNYKMLITSFSCAFVPYCASVLGGTEKQYEKPLFCVVIVQCAAHCEAVSMVNRSRKR